MLKPLRRYISSLSEASKTKAALNVLGCSSNASFPEIKASFAKLCKVLHPDVSKSEDNGKFSEIIESYQYLKQLNEKNSRMFEDISNPLKKESNEFNLQKMQSEISEKYKEIFYSNLTGNCDAFFQSDKEKRNVFLNFIENYLAENAPNVSDFDSIFPLYSHFVLFHENEAKNEQTKKQNESESSSIIDNSFFIYLSGIISSVSVFAYFFIKRISRNNINAFQIDQNSANQNSPKQNSEIKSEKSKVAQKSEKSELRIIKPYVKLSSPTKFYSGQVTLRFSSNLNDFMIYHTILKDIELYVAKDELGVEEANLNLIKGQTTGNPKESYKLIKDNSYSGKINLAIATETIFKKVFVKSSQVKKQLEEKGYFICPLIHFWFDKGNILVRVTPTKTLNNSLDLSNPDDYICLFELYFSKNSEILDLSDFAGGFKLSKLFNLRRYRGINGLIYIERKNYKPYYIKNLNYSKPYYYDTSGQRKKKSDKKTNWVFYTKMRFPQIYESLSNVYQEKVEYC